MSLIVSAGDSGQLADGSNLVFSEVTISKTVSDETQTKILTLDSCQSVSKADIESGTTYLGIMQNNLNVLREALN